MAKYRITALVMTMALTFTWGCERFMDRSSDLVLARVGQEELTLQYALDHIPGMILQQDTLTALDNYKTSWVEQKVIENEARRIGLDRNPEILERVEQLKSQLIKNAFRENILASHYEELEVSTEEAQNYYQANREFFLLEERYVRFRHVIAETRADANSARQAIMRGVSWPDVAESYSLSPNRQILESERYVPLSLAVSDIPSMAGYLERIGITEISVVEEHGGHYHFVQLMNEKPQGDHPDLEWLIEQIKEWLYLEKSRRLINSYNRNLYLRADSNNEIEVMELTSLQNALHNLEN